MVVVKSLGSLPLTALHETCHLYGRHSMHVLPVYKKPSSNFDCRAISSTRRKAVKHIAFVSELRESFVGHVYF